jgi:hypothetical protein
MRRRVAFATRQAIGPTEICKDRIDGLSHAWRYRPISASRAMPVCPGASEPAARGRNMAARSGPQ